MSHIREIKQVSKSIPTLEGAGVHLKRAFGFRNHELYDPFLLLDDFGSDNPQDYEKGFPWHPHRGIETITYILEGAAEHGDNMGNKGIIAAGDVQWMTAGSGIIHQEMPSGDLQGRMFGFQLWANLPKTHKMMPPRYQEVKRDQIITAQLENGVTAQVICGEIGGVKGPVKDIVTNPRYLDVRVPGGAAFSLPTQLSHTALAYIFEGQGRFDPQSDLLDKGTLVLFDDGDVVNGTAAPDGMRFLLISGQPIREPVAWYGPIVMNTQAELQTAFQELQDGTFIKQA